MSLPVDIKAVDEKQLSAQSQGYAMSQPVAIKTVDERAIIGSKSMVDYIAMSQPIAVKTVDGKAIPIFLPPLWKINNIPLFLPHGYPAA
ncbi:MAG: hypothetical protein RR198_00925 [Oscillospiraceae bacterium]